VKSTFDMPHKPRPGDWAGEDSAFAAAVRARYKWNISTDPNKGAFKGGASLDVCRVANGLACLHALVVDYMNRTRLSGDDIAATDIGDASAILDHLVNGTSHRPMSRHLRGSRAAGAPKANGSDLLVKRIVVATLRAMMVTEAPGLNEAAKILATGLLVLRDKKKLADFSPPSRDQIKTWHYEIGTARDSQLTIIQAVIMRNAAARESSAVTEGAELILEHARTATG
jgi:hypothetical protein